MVGGMFVSVGVAVTSQLSMVEIAGFEPVSYYGCTFPVPEVSTQKKNKQKNPSTRQWQWRSGYIPCPLTYVPWFKTGYWQKVIIK